MCQSCNTCQNCNSCNDCNTCQYRCQLNAQTVSSECQNTFKFRDKAIEDNSLFLSADEWNSLIKYIYNGYKLQDYFDYSQDYFSTYNGKDIRAGKSFNNEFMSANMFNGAYAKMKYLGTGNSSLGNWKKKGGPEGDIIRAKYFNDLQEYANTEMKIQKGTRCVTCNNCNSCDSCEGCNTCNGDNSCCEPVTSN